MNATIRFLKKSKSFLNIDRKNDIDSFSEKMPEIQAFFLSFHEK